MPTLLYLGSRDHVDGREHGDYERGGGREETGAPEGEIAEADGACGRSQGPSVNQSQDRSLSTFYNILIVDHQDHLVLTSTLTPPRLPISHQAVNVFNNLAHQTSANMRTTFSAANTRQRGNALVQSAGKSGRPPNLSEVAKQESEQQVSMRVIHSSDLTLPLEIARA